MFDLGIFDTFFKWLHVRTSLIHGLEIQLPLIFTTTTLSTTSKHGYIIMITTRAISFSQFAAIKYFTVYHYMIT